MRKDITGWLAFMAATAITFSMIDTSTATAQPPGRGPGVAGPGGPWRGGPPNLGELFSRMDKNNDGKLSKDEVPDQLWNFLSRADANHDGEVTRDEASRKMSDRRPDGVRTEQRLPDSSPNDRPRGDQPRTQESRPPMPPSRGDSARAADRGPRDASPERGRPTPPRPSHEPSHRPTDRPEVTRRGPGPFDPNAFFDRLDKNNDGSLSRDEFKAVAELHRNFTVPHAPKAFGDNRPPFGPPWAGHRPGDSRGPNGFSGSPPSSRLGQGSHFGNPPFGPPWARHRPHRDNVRAHGHGSHRSHDGHHGRFHGKKKHRGDAGSRDKKPHNSKHEKKKCSDSDRPDKRDRTDASTPQPNVELTSASPSDVSVTSAAPATAALPL
ncbi:MAG: hypothetical protein H6822_16950 [Planctomycetaceae bacterium]|nr:hypothetical protein [Planctomycetales bacterium]MCB9923873.1 hypothetical protein [Planctomycetaceae bacterium]